MKILKQTVARVSESSEFLTFLWKSKLWFLIPFVILLLLFSFILVFAQATGVAPFIYTLI